MTRIVDEHFPVGPRLLDLDAVASTASQASDQPISDVSIQSISYLPGQRAVAQYESLDTDGRAVHFSLWAGRKVPDGGTPVTVAGEGASLWWFPDDPRLPGLAYLYGSEGRQRVRSEMGGRDEVGIRLRSYRAGRRAVAEVHSGSVRAFAKVVRPERASHLVGLHAALANALPIPRNLWHSIEQGIVLLEPIRGSTLTDLLRGDRELELPDPSEVLATLDPLADLSVPATTRPTPTDLAPRSASVLAALIPTARPELKHMLSVIREAPDAGPVTTAHRDFHAGQILVDGASLALIDIDTIGPGTRADDMAMFVAQLECLARPGPDRASIDAYRDRTLAAISHIDTAVLAPRVSAAILGFAVGPFRVQEAEWREECERRIGKARRWALGPEFS